MYKRFILMRNAALTAHFNEKTEMSITAYINHNLIIMKKSIMIFCSLTDIL